MLVDVVAVVWGGREAAPGVIRDRWKYDQVGLRNVDWRSICGFSASLRLRFFGFAVWLGGAASWVDCSAGALALGVSVSTVDVCACVLGVWFDGTPAGGVYSVAAKGDLGRRRGAM